MLVTFDPVRALRDNPYARLLGASGMLPGFPPAGLDPTAQFAQMSSPQRVAPDPSSQQWAASPVPCAVAHRQCYNSGRDPIDCLKALKQCSQNGVDTIFGPGIWGRPV